MSRQPPHRIAELLIRLAYALLAVLVVVALMAIGMGLLRWWPTPTP